MLNSKAGSDQKNHLLEICYLFVHLGLELFVLFLLLSLIFSLLQLLWIFLIFSLVIHLLGLCLLLSLFLCMLLLQLFFPESDRQVKICV